MRIKSTLRFLALTASIAACGSGMADNYTETLLRIAGGNRSLRASTLVTEAARAENLTGLTLANPEVDFAYQWGSPSEVEDKILLDVSQSFDFATLSGAKKDAARARNRIADAELDAERVRIIGDADALMTKAVYLQRLDNLYSTIECEMASMMEAARKSVGAGILTAVDANSIRMELSTLSSEKKVNRIELDGTTALLRCMAGGNELDWTPADYMEYMLPAQFSSWCQEAVERNPATAVARETLLSADSEIKLRRREGLPEFSLGYTSEMVRSEDYYGVSLGVSLPLWGNKGRVKAAKAAKVAAEAQLADARYNSALDLRMKFDKAVALGEAAREADRLCRECDISQQINRMYELGQISVHDYLSQLLPLLNLSQKALESNYNYQQALVDLRTAAADY